MSRRDARAARTRSRTGLYLLAACCLVIGALLFGLNVINNPSATETVNKVSPPETAEAPEVLEEAKEEKPAEKEKKDDKEVKAAEEKQNREEENREEEKADKEPAEEEAVEQEVAEAEPAEEPEEAAIPAASGTDLSLTVPKMGLYDDPIVNDVSEATLMNGAGKIPESGFPWEEGANTYIASHVLGYEGTGSYLHFAALPNMAYGDEIVLKDSNGTAYTYRVNEILEVSIYETWVINPTGEDIVSLQTCINPPAYDVRLVVRGERVSVDVA